MNLFQNFEASSNSEADEQEKEHQRASDQNRMNLREQLNRSQKGHPNRRNRARNQLP
jgi:hypothetical protein